MVDSIEGCTRMVETLPLLVSVYGQRLDYVRPAKILALQKRSVDVIVSVVAFIIGEDNHVIGT